MRLMTVLLILGLLAVPVVQGANFQTDSTPLQNNILPNESASFKLTITNFEKFPQRFLIYTLDTRWILHVEPSITTVEPSSVREYTVTAKPKTTVGFGSEAITLLIKNLDADVIAQQDLYILVRDPEASMLDFMPSVRVDTSLPQSVNPRNNVRIGLAFRNRNALNITGMTVQLHSAIFEREFVMDLPPLSERTEEVFATLDPYQPAGTYDLAITLFYQNSSINELKTKLTVDEIRDVQETAHDESKLFRSVSTLRIENKGNVVAVYDAKLPTNWFRSIFTSTTPSVGTLKRGGQRYYVWNLTLKPKETAEVTMVENYRLLVIIIVLAILGVIAYYLLRSPVIAVKEAISQKDGEETSALKVRIFLKNRTGRQIEGVNVIDRIPSIASYVRQETLGVVSPTKVVTSEKKGTMLKWELDNLEPYEERIINYAMRSNLKILGKMTLPNAKVTFLTKNGQERASYTKEASFEE
jgi:hypothetical protein